MSAFDHGTKGEDVVKKFAAQVKGKTFVITGPSAGGVGAQIVVDLACGQPAKIVLAGRNLSKIEPVIKDIKAIDSSINVEFVQVDLTDQSSIRKAAEDLAKKAPKIDVLINNAGIMATKDYKTTKEGIELQFGTNHIGHFLMTNLVLPQIIAAGSGARIINVSSYGYALAGVRFDDYNFGNGANYHLWFGYAQSKTANFLFTATLAEKLQSKNIQSFVLTPGLVLETNLQNNVTPEMFEFGKQTYMKEFEGRFEEMPPLETPKPLVAGSSTALVAALDPSIASKSGAFLTDAQIQPKVQPHAQGKENSEKLWALSEKLVNQKFDI